jgi:hypothetical protein
MIAKELSMTAADFITLRTVSPAWQAMIPYNTQGRIAVESRSLQMCRVHGQIF